MRKKVSMAAVVLMTMFLLASCSMFQQQTIQESWNKLTPDEQARVVVGGLQKNLNQKFDEGKAIVVANPQHQALWKGQIVPAFDKANKTLKSVSDLAQAGKITPEGVYAKFKPDLDALILLALQLGLKI